MAVAQTEWSKTTHLVAREFEDESSEFLPDSSETQGFSHSVLSVPGSTIFPFWDTEIKSSMHGPLGLIQEPIYINFWLKIILFLDVVLQGLCNF